MDQTQAERIRVLTRDTYHEAFDVLQTALPPPKSAAPADLDRRDNRAMAEVAGLVPVNAAEVKLAVLFVSAGAHAERMLGKITDEGPAAEKSRTQATSMMRQAFVGLSLLMRLQESRVKRDANNASADSAAWIEHFALEYMMEARAARQGRPAPAAEPVSETKSQFADNETVVRPADRAPAAPPRLVPVPQDVSQDATAPRFVTSETMPRRGDEPGRLPAQPAAAIHLDPGVVATMSAALAQFERRTSEARRGRASLFAGTSLS